MVIEKIDEITQALIQGGIDATADPQYLNPPCAWICARRVDEMSLCGEVMTISFDVYLIYRAVEIPNVLYELDHMLTQALFALDEYSIESVTLDEAVTLPQGGGPMPAYKINIVA